MNVDDIVKLLVGVSLSFSMVGVSVQLMRVLGTLNSGMNDLRYIAFKIGDFLDNLDKDYHKISGTIGRISDPIGQISDNIFGPLVDVSSLFGLFIQNVAAKVLKSK